MLSTKVILLNVTNLSDARYAAGMGVEYIGFSINPVSNHYVTSEDANAISNWLSGISLIGNIGNSIAEYEQYKIDYLLTDNTSLINDLDEPILSFDLTKDNYSQIENNLSEFKGKTSFFILKIDPQEISFLIEEIEKLNESYDCFISSEFDEKTLQEILKTNPTGIVLFGSHEEKPGLSNYDGIADVLEMLDE